ncbi:MAG: AMP-binding protein [Alphaproteobacteria bacterium]|nr:AMP-binding protein [Alphaproteobacteria bacterium]
MVPTNLCHNAVDRHLSDRAQQNALIFVSTETDQEVVYTFAQLHAEVQRMAAILLDLGVKKGDRVLIYMPMISEACFAMLACARIGAIHSVVFGGFASHSLATRIDDATPHAIISADAGSRGGKGVVPYKPLLDEAISLAHHKPAAVLMVDRKLADDVPVAGRDHDYATLRAKHLNTQVPCEWVESTHPSYTLYTSGTTGKPKGVHRDTGGYAVALAASMKHIYGGNPGETFFSTSDIGWVVGHLVVCRQFGAMTSVLSKPTGPAFPVKWSTAHSTGPSETKMGTISSWAAPMMSLTWLATAWVLARSKRASPVTRTSQKWPLWAWPTHSKDRWSWRLPSPKTPVA